MSPILSLYERTCHSPDPSSCMNDMSQSSGSQISQAAIIGGSIFILVLFILITPHVINPPAATDPQHASTQTGSFVDTVTGYGGRPFFQIVGAVLGYARQPVEAHMGHNLGSISRATPAADGPPPTTFPPRAFLPQEDTHPGPLPYPGNAGVGRDGHASNLYPKTLHD
ncbi:hypothetical protein BU17DRAFT_71933 [Hysterangium stoloniferum]|nr:hypothetical protein BU17DRAFT_71933 [Hysterangium stoloniferum]